MTLAAGTRLGSYEILAPLGVGGMGEVYRARDSKLHREVALKVIPSRVDSDLATLDRFQREARTAAALNHPHIVTIYAVEEFDGRVFLAMEFVDGHTLADLIPSDGLPIDTLLKHAIPLADALSAAHAHGITHRDLKPSNVMVTKDGRVKVLDFGLAKLREPAVQLDGTSGPTQALTGEGHIVGTVAYMSPEQAAAGAVDERSDLFSLGVMIYEMATGMRPFGGDGSVSTLAAILKDTPKPITDVRPQLPRDLSRIVRRALAKDPEQRYQSPRLFRVALDGGTPTQISNDFAMSATLSPDGRYVASFSFGAGGRQDVVLRAVETGAAQRSFDIVSVPLMLGFTSTGDALTFLESRKGAPALWNQPVDGGAPQRLLDMNGERIFSFAWSRDGRLAIAHGPVPTDVVLISGMQ